jgi:hypothetical protein
MNHTEAEYRSLFHQAFPDQLLKAHLLGVIDGYAATPAACRKALDRPDQHDGFGMIRRGKIHEQLRGVAERHSLHHADEKNDTGSAFFLSTFVGCFRLVALLAGTRRRIRPAKIREHWARHNRDGRWTTLFPKREEPIPADVKYVAFLIHNPRSRRRDQPAFVEIVIPDRQCRTFICKFDLFQMFPQVANDMAKSREATRTDPKRRKGGKEKENLA